jgi:hypothetical protein
VRALKGFARFGATYCFKHSRRKAVLCPPVADRPNKGKMLTGCKPEGFAPAAGAPAPPAGELRAPRTAHSMAGGGFSNCFVCCIVGRRYLTLPYSAKQETRAHD